MRHTYTAHGSQIPGVFVVEDHMKMNLPLSYGAGLAFRLSDALTIAFDAYRTEWGRYFFRDDFDRKTSPIDSRPRNESHINATTQVHVRS